MQLIFVFMQFALMPFCSYSGRQAFNPQRAGQPHRATDVRNQILGLPGVGWTSWLC
jgi:hypothetical protein